MKRALVITISHLLTCAGIALILLGAGMVEQDGLLGGLLCILGGGCMTYIFLRLLALIYHIK